MARRQARFTVRDLANASWLRDHSADLWDETHGEVRRGLLSSAVQCFASNGFHATTTRDICEGVNLTPGALYVHFQSKELVLFEIVRTGHERALTYTRGPAVPASTDSTDSADRLRGIVSRHTEWHARHHVAARVCQYELNSLAPEHYDEVLELRHQTNSVFRDAVASGVADGSFARIDVERVTRAILSLSIDLVRWYRLEGSDSPEQLGAFYADLALSMVTHGGTRTETPPTTG